ncbi:unnamed protein product [Mytilus coruscus]|uniref:Uncharacterized protein n=1 Tax=Mytilus coruscus TaxID=42192 RepID=A0A6J8D6L7_MYTCO|nr:unnamed protein product [Mytilus coruscus]
MIDSIIKPIKNQHQNYIMQKSIKTNNFKVCHQSSIRRFTLHQNILFIIKMFPKGCRPFNKGLIGLQRGRVAPGYKFQHNRTPWNKVPVLQLSTSPDPEENHAPAVEMNVEQNAILDESPCTSSTSPADNDSKKTRSQLLVQSADLKTEEEWAINTEITDKQVIFFDCETTQDTLLQCESGNLPSVERCQNCKDKDKACTQCKLCQNCGKSSCGTKEHKVNFICMQTACDRCKDKQISNEPKCNFCGVRCSMCDKKEKKVFKTTPV